MTSAPAEFTPRITPGGRSDVGLLSAAICRIAGRVARTNAPHLFLTMARRRGLFLGWLLFAGRLMPGGTLPRRETELVILRVAALTGCDYEAAHHRRMARRAGVGADEVEAVMTAQLDPQPWSERERAILAATDELHADRDLSDATFDALRRHLDEGETVELVMLIGHYEMLATFLTTLRVQPDLPLH